MSGFGPTTAKVERTRRLKLAACFGLASVFAVAAEDAYPPAVISAGKAVYQIDVPGSRGTSFFIAPNRLATNFHVVDSIQDMGGVSLFFDNEPSPIRATRLLAVSFPYDLALLETEGSPAVHLSAGGSPQGTAYTIGYPDTSDLQYHHSVSDVTVLDAHYEGFFNFGEGTGSSGSPVLDSQGRFFAVIFASGDGAAAASKKSFVDARWLAQLANGREGTLCQGGAQACLDHEISRTRKLAYKVLSGHSIERKSLGIFHTAYYGRREILGENEKEYLERMATNFDDLGAQFSLGILHRDEGDLEKAFEWFGAAAEGGVPNAQYGLGILHRDHGDLEKAFEWLGAAAEGGVPLAQFNLGILHRDHGDLEKAFEWLGAAAEGGVPMAQYDLGVLYDDRDEWEKAARWYKSAAELGVTDAQYNLSEMYRYGEGVERNDELADYWMAKCSEAGDTQCSCKATGEGSECSE